MGLCRVGIRLHDLWINLVIHTLLINVMLVILFLKPYIKASETQPILARKRAAIFYETNTPVSQ